MEFKEVIRQGDIFLFPVKAIPACKPVDCENGRVVLAHGEVTGHSHAFDGDGVALLEGEGERWLDVKKRSILKHESHGHLKVEKGFYKVVQQREYTPEAITYVRD